MNEYNMCVVVIVVQFLKNVILLYIKPDSQWDKLKKGDNLIFFSRVFERQCLYYLYALFTFVYELTVIYLTLNELYDQGKFCYILFNLKYYFLNVCYFSLTRKALKQQIFITFQTELLHGCLQEFYPSQINKKFATYFLLYS